MKAPKPLLLTIAFALSITLGFGSVAYQLASMNSRIDHSLQRLDSTSSVQTRTNSSSTPEQPDPTATYLRSRA